jgi:hypothetical protein
LNVPSPERARWWKLSLKRCPLCRKQFKPDPRIKDRQKVCSNAECQKRRKKEYQKKWKEKNPMYFQGRYSRLKEWLAEHPDYLKNYRQSSKNHLRSSTQEDTRRKRLSSPEVRAELETRLLHMEQFFKKLPCHDIQVAIGPENPAVKPCCAQFTPG